MTDDVIDFGERHARRQHENKEIRAMLEAELGDIIDYPDARTTIQVPAWAVLVVAVALIAHRAAS